MQPRPGQFRTPPKSGGNKTSSGFSGEANHKKIRGTTNSRKKTVTNFL